MKARSKIDVSAKIQAHEEALSSASQGSSRFTTLLLIVGVVLLAINQRACITAVGPLIGAIRAETGISSTLAGLITTLPLLAFGFFSPLAPRLGRRWGMEKILLASLLGLTAGIALRSLPLVSLLFLGTALLGSAIAIANVLLPALIKRDFPRQVGLMTGLYSTLLNVGGALADGVSIPLEQNAGLGWRGSLLFWAYPAAFATLFWLLLVWARPRIAGARETGVPVRRLWRSSLAWQVTFFMGLQSLLFYATITWLPLILQRDGLSAASAGWMLSLIQFMGVLSAFLVPLLAERMRSQRLLVLTFCLLALLACAGLLFSPPVLIPLWCICFGLAVGAFLSLALLFFVLRTPDTHAAAGLSGMAQSVGYLLAALGPLIFGWLHDVSHAWTIPLLAMIVTLLLILCAGMGAARDAVIEPVHRDKVGVSL